MAQMTFKKLVRNKTWIEKRDRPFAFNIDNCVPLKVDRFETVGKRYCVVGTDIRDGTEVRIFRNGVRPDNDPLVESSKNVSKGGYMIFTGCKPAERDFGMKTLLSDGYRTITNGRDNSTANIISDALVFVATNEQKKYQTYNLIHPEKTQKVSSPVETLKHLYDSIASGKSESFLIRGFSKEEKIGIAIQATVLGAKTPSDIKSGLENLLKAQHKVHVVGDWSDVPSMSGEDFFELIGTTGTDMQWEVIPVEKLYRTIPAVDDESRANMLASARKVQNAYSLNQENQSGFLRTTMGIRSREGDTSMFDSVVAVYHEDSLPYSLAAVPTYYANPIKELNLDHSLEEKVPAANVDEYEAENLWDFVKNLSDEVQMEARKTTLPDDFDFLSQEDFITYARMRQSAVMEDEEIDIDLISGNPEFSPATEDPFEQGKGDEVDISSLTAEGSEDEVDISIFAAVKEEQSPKLRVRQDLNELRKNSMIRYGGQENAPKESKRSSYAKENTDTNKESASSDDDIMSLLEDNFDDIARMMKI